MSARLWRWYVEPAPPERLAVFRVLLCTYAVAWVAFRTPFWVDLARLPSERSHPVGVLSPPGWALPPAAVLALSASTLVAGVAAAAGWRWRASGPALAAGFLVLGTHGASWGQVLHTEQLPALHLLILAASPAADALSIDARRAGGRRPPRSVGGHTCGWPLRALSLVTVATYAVAGVAKLRYTGVGWVDGELLRNLVAHDNLRKRLLGDPSSPLAPLVVGHPAVFAPAALLTLLVELGAPLALLGGRLRAVWAATAWAFHVGVLALMAVLFPYPLLGLAFAPLFRLERLPAALTASWQRRSPRPQPAS